MVTMKNNDINQVPEWRKKNKRFDNGMKALIYGCVLFTMVVVLGIVLFIFSKGIGVLSPQFFTNDYDAKTVYAEFDFGDGIPSNSISLERVDNTYVVKSIQSSSFGKGYDATGKVYQLSKGDEIISVDKEALTGDAEAATDTLTALEGNTTLKVKIAGGGIRPMAVATLMIILLTLLFSVPVGVAAAVYLNEYAKEGRLLKIIRFAIESLAGIPSIIYGLFGMLFFVTLLHFNYSILAGALTVAIILLPTIISTTEEALKAVPRGLREGSLALGATQFQTVRKVVLPNAIPGILTAIVLSIGRIIGESAALYLTAGTVARIPASMMESASTLTVKVYTVTKEEGNIEMASAIGIVIIVLILVLNAITRSLQRINRLK